MPLRSDSVRFMRTTVRSAPKHTTPNGKASSAVSSRSSSMLIGGKTGCERYTMATRRVIVFRNRLRDDISAQYDRHAEEVYRRASTMRGFVSSKDFISDEGEPLALIEWDSADDLAVWRDDIEHR